MSNEDSRRIALAEQEARDDFAKEIDSKILDSFAFLAGLLASAREDDTMETTEALHNVGSVIGLMVQGSRKELEIQRSGGEGACFLQRIIDGAQPNGTTN